MTKENRNMYVVKDTKLGNIYSKENKKETDSVDKLLKKGESIVLKREDIEIKKALEIVVKQMRNNGNRERTINDYVYYVLDYIKKTKTYYVSDINLTSIYEWFETMEVTNSTKKIRYKSLSAVLGRFYDNGWLEKKFWKSINIKVDEKIKQPAKWEDIELLLGMLDFNNFFQLRDACAILLMWQTGIRIRTLSYLEEKDIDFENKVLLLNGEIMKNHKFSKLPLSEELLNMIEVLIQQNKIIRKRMKQRNKLVFITQKGDTIQKYDNTNAIRKRLTKYALDYNLKNINPHSIRRGYALNLLKKGASVVLISKALSHSDIAVTTKYLYLDTEETLDELRTYL
ncbi:site-specific integrase [Carnobacterium maltaromaticum]|uniref:tyrosine-type recombinase/integrase n=1 Tax=Carnobacterium maltaromaticum TaxID=2751 RepID=UPI00295E2263|nr:site-specific integrase [Carnobacterium maltaromaticum]